MYKTSVIGSTSGTYYERRVWAGPDTPLHLRKAGIFLDNPYSGSTEIIVNPRTSKIWYAPNGQSIEVGASETNITSYCTISDGPGVLPNASDMISALASKWRNTDLNLGLVLSPEGRESVEMMASAIQRIGVGASRLRKGDVTGFIRSMDHLPRSSRRAVNRRFNQGDLSGAFLGAHLGWEPLLKDVYAASNIEPPASISQRLEVKGSAKGRYIQPNNLYPGMSWQGKNFYTEKYIVDVKRTPSWSERFGLNNPFLTAWNLVPLSFVADYFLPISSTIDSLGFVSAQATTRGWKKTYSHWESAFTFAPGTIGTWLGGVKYAHREPLTRFAKNRTYSRTPWTPSLGETLGWRLKLPSSLTKLATLSALTHQSILRLK